MLLYWWFAFFRPQDRLWFDISSWRLPLVAAALFLIATIIRRQTPQLNDSITKLMLLWLGMAAIAHFSMGCGNAGPLGNALVYMSTLILMVLLSERVIENEKNIVYLLIIVAVPFCYFASKSGIGSILGGGASNYGAKDFTGVFTGSNAFALGTGMMVFLMLFLLQQTFNTKTLSYFPSVMSHRLILLFMRGAILVMTGACVYYIMSLQSRGSSLATFFALFVFAILNKVKLKWFLMVIPAAILIVAFVPLPEGYEERIKSAFEDKEELDESAKSRPHFWATARLMASDHIFGVGPGCYQSYFDYYDSTGGQFGRSRSVHSSHFQVLSETGYTGLLVWILLFAFTYRRLFALRKSARSYPERYQNSKLLVSLSNTLICSQSVFLLAGSFYALAYNDLLWLIWAITIATTRIMKQQFHANAPSKTSAAYDSEAQAM